MIKLTATNYTLLRPQMEELFNCIDLFDPLDVKEKNLDPIKEA